MSAPTDSVRSAKWPLWVTGLLLLVSCLMMGRLGLTGTLDQRFYYSAQEASTYLNGLGPEQSRLYTVNECWDLIFLAAYSALAVLLLRRLKSPLSFLPYLGLVPGFFDFAETSGILILLQGMQSEALLQILGWTTCLKWTSGVFLVVGYFVYRKIYRN